MFHHLALLHSQFCWIPSCSSRIGQTVWHLNSSQPNPGPRPPVSRCTSAEFCRRPDQSVSVSTAPAKYGLFLVYIIVWAGWLKGGQPQILSRRRSLTWVFHLVPSRYGLATATWSHNPFRGSTCNTSTKPTQRHEPRFSNYMNNLSQTTNRIQLPISVM